MAAPSVRPLTHGDLPWADELLERELGARMQVRRGELHDVLALPGFVAERDGERVGLLTYGARSDECELAVLVALERGTGVGSVLVDAFRSVLGGRRGWLVTTNDNLDALRFYQRRGWRLAALRPGAVDEARRALKPRIGEIGEHGIPLRDELELELREDVEPTIPEE